MTESSIPAAAAVLAAPTCIWKLCPEYSLVVMLASISAD